MTGVGAPVFAMEPQALNVSPASARPAIERAASKGRMGDRGYQKQSEKGRILIRLSSADRGPGGTGCLPQGRGEGSMLRWPWMKPIGGQPVIAPAGFTADLGDVAITGNPRWRFCPSNRIGCVELPGQVNGRAA